MKMTQNNLPEMTAEDAVELVKLFEQNQIEVTLDGGWGVDALLGEQTRRHDDLDIVVAYQAVTQLRGSLEKKGFRDISRANTRECNFVMGDEQGRLIDIHTYTFDPDGHPEFGIDFPLESLIGVGSIMGYPVRCVSGESIVNFHTGYPVDEKDYHDVKALCQCVGIKIPAEFEAFEK
jgi:lincosamide nucleotidyltransferase A/C/D/E